MTTATAPGKLILCGEHAVVYGQPAIALPVSALRATATVELRDRGGVRFEAPDLRTDWALVDQPAHPLSQLVLATLRHVGQDDVPAMLVTLRSTIPIASGMGSGAALGAALVRAIAQVYGRDLQPAEVSALVFESERGFHGTPSGIDNTVVSFDQPIVFQRTETGARIEPIAVGRPAHLLIGDTGQRCPTLVTVGEVRQRWLADPSTYEARFKAIGQLVNAIRQGLATAEPQGWGPLLTENHAELQRIGVSSEDLDRLVAAACAAGAWGAKLSGGGGGGVMLALVDPETAPAVTAALVAAGATAVFHTTLATTKAAA